MSDYDTMKRGFVVLRNEEGGFDMHERNEDGTTGPFIKNVKPGTSGVEGDGGSEI